MADFPDKVFKSVDKGFKNITSKGKELLSTTRIRSEIKNIQASIQKNLEVLGKKVYGMVCSAELKEEEIKKNCDEIALLYKKITELETELEKIEEDSLKRQYGEDIVLCFKCKGVNRADDKFCKNCGTNIQEIPTSEGPKCSGCSAILKEGELFCTNCGKKQSD
ncbi:MAG: zinc ribbon domain-containing protein [Candidatus Ratteibacteria bacterium]